MVEWNISFLLWLNFAVLIYAEEEANDLEAVVSMLCCGALQRNNNTYIESIMEPVFLRIRKRSSLCGFGWEKNPEKGLRQWKKVLWAESWICVCVRVCACVCVYVCVCACSCVCVLTALISLQSLSLYIRNVNLLKKDFKSAGLLT